MDVPICLVRHAGLDQDCIRYPRIELRLEVARDPPAEKRGGIAKHDRSSIEGADNCARACSLRVDQHCGNRVGEFARLTASLDVSPACRRRHDGYMNSLDDLA